MSRDKQIEEMRVMILTELSNAVNAGLVTWNEFADYLSHQLYNADYRKASDVAEEIFAENDEMVITEKSNDGCAFYLDIVELAELKKKYTESDKDNG